MTPGAASGEPIAAALRDVLLDFGYDFPPEVPDRITAAVMERITDEYHSPPDAPSLRAALERLPVIGTAYAVGHPKGSPDYCSEHGDIDRHTSIKAHIEAEHMPYEAWEALEQARAALAAAPEQPAPITDPASLHIGDISDDDWQRFHEAAAPPATGGLDDNFDPNPKIDPYALDAERLATILDGDDGGGGHFLSRQGDAGEFCSCGEWDDLKPITWGQHICAAYAATLGGREAK